MKLTEEQISRIMKVMVYIEEHLDEKMAMKELSKLAFYSPSHFHRIFHEIIGEPLHQYIKRLQIEKAARRLRNSETLVTEIAFVANYNTPSAFTKAFKQLIGKSPINFRKHHSSAKKINNLPVLKPDSIEKTSDLHLLFIRRTGHYNESGMKAWKAMERFINASSLELTKLRFFGILNDDTQITAEVKVRYDACILVPQDIKEKGELGRKVIKSGQYAIFTHLGAYSGLKETFQSIFLNWLPESQEKLESSKPCFCEYFNLEYARNDPSKLVTKLYIPLI